MKAKKAQSTSTKFSMATYIRVNSLNIFNKEQQKTRVCNLALQSKPGEINLSVVRTLLCYLHCKSVGHNFVPSLVSKTYNRPYNLIKAPLPSNVISPKNKFFFSNSIRWIPPIKKNETPGNQTLKKVANQSFRKVLN